MVRLDGEAYRVIGVMPRGFVFPSGEATAWMPYHVGPAVHPDGSPAVLSMFRALARLRRGATSVQAAAEATALARHAPDPGFATMAWFGTRGAPEVSVVPAKEALTAEVRPALLLLLAAIGLLLAAATANVASLQLVRATARRRELAIRSALGAGQGRLARLLLGESLILGALGGAAGLAVAAVGVRVLPSLLPTDFPRLEAVALDLRVTAFCAALALLCGLAAGLLPALTTGRLKVATAIATEARGVARGGGLTAMRVRTVILAGQVAVATVLLLGALQLSRSFFKLLSVDRGFEADHLLTMRLPLPDPAYDPERRQQIVSHALERLRGLPGVAEVAMTTIAPLSQSEAMAAWSVTTDDGSAAEQASASVRQVTPGYFRALRRRILEGRPLLESDVGSAPVIVVNLTFARRYLGQPAVGSPVPAWRDGKRADWTVVGVVEDLVHGNVTDPVQPEMIYDYRQLQDGLTYAEPTLLVRTSGEPQALVPAVRALLREADPTLAPEAIVPMIRLLRESLARPRLYSTLLALFAGCAMVIVGVGLFGSLSYGVTLRTREIGVRLALGARPRDIGLLITRSGLVVAGSGTAVGLAASMAFGRLLRDLLYGVQPHDAIGLLSVPTVLLLLAIAVSLVPALRAATVDPQDALRTE
jgi:predicted permease